MRECPSCGWSMVSTHRLEEREPRWLCVNSKCPSTHKPATLDDVLDELRAIHAMLAEAQRDADRYRYLRAHSTFFDPSQNDTGFLRQPPRRIWFHETPYIGADTLDVAIDAAKGESNGT